MSKFLTRPWLYILIILIGTALKFYKLDDQFFWDDEVATILHVSGVSMADYEKSLPVNQIVGKNYYLDILSLNSQDLPIFKQIIGLTKMPQLTPGHYYYLIFWIRVFGDGYMSYRFFSIFMFLLALPFFFLLARKLFDSDLAGWLAVSFYAVSPFFQVYAQEARYYILWSAGMLIMHYIFLNAVEKQNRKWWIIYIVAGAFTVHISILNFVVLFTHAVYYAIYYRAKWKPLLLSLSLIFLSSLPWLAYIYINRENIQGALSWQSTTAFGEHKFHYLVEEQLIGVSKLFVNLWGRTDGVVRILSRWLPWILLLGSTLLLFRKATGKQIWFVALLSFTGMLAFLVIDVLRGSFTSYLTRYHLLFYPGMILLMTYGFKELHRRSPIVFLILFLMLVTGGLVSSKNVSDNYCSLKRDGDCSYHLEDAAELFSGEEKILIISDYQLIGPRQYSMIMSLLLKCENENMDVLYAKADYPSFKQDFDLEAYDELYAMYLSEELKAALLSEFPGDEMEMIRERKMFGQFDLPVYKIKVRL